MLNAQLNIENDALMMEKERARIIAAHARASRDIAREKRDRPG